RNGRNHMSRGEAAADIGSTMEEGIRIIPLLVYILRTPSGSHGVQDRAEHFGIGDSFAGEERGLLHIRISALEADGIKRGGDGDCFRARHVAAKGSVKIAENVGVIEIRSSVRIRG